MTTINNEIFVKRLAITHPRIKPLTEYITAKAKITMECMVDGNIWVTTPDNLLSGCGCPKCGIASSAKSKRSSMEAFLKKLHEVNAHIEISGRYINARTHVHCKCMLDGYEWDSTPDNLLHGCGCRKCGSENRMKTIRTKGGKTYRRTHSEFINKLSNVNKNVEILDEYHDSNHKVRCKCLIHGEIWKTTPVKLLQGRHACPMCNASMGEKAIAELLKYKGINYIMQYRFKNCRRIYPLPFDFYLPDNNICIEYDGKQHEPGVNMFNNDKEAAEECDRIKDAYCIEHGIKLIRVPYSIINIENYVLERL